MLYKVFHGSRHRQLEFTHSLMYASKDLDVAVSYAKNRYATSEDTYVHRLIFEIKRPASGKDVQAAVDATGGIMDDDLSEAHALTFEKVLSALKRQGFDGAVKLWDFAFDGPEEIEVLAVFDAFSQVELVDQEPYMVIPGRARR